MGSRIRTRKERILRIRSGRFQSINFTEGLTSEAIEEKIAVLEAEIIINQEKKGI